MSRKQIAIDSGDYYPDAPINSGIKRIVANVLCQFDQSNNQVVVHRYFYRRWGRLFGTLRLPLLALLHHDDVFLGFSGQIPELLRLGRIKKILFLYDLGFFRYPYHLNRSAGIISQTKRSLVLADAVVVSSRTTKQELLEKFPHLNPEKIHQLYPGIDHLINTEPLPCPSPLKKYFLSVGVIKPSKDTESLIKLFARFLTQSKDQAVKLVLAGRSEAEYKKSVLQLINRLKIKNRVQFMDNVPDGQLVTLYKNCIACLNTAKTEGFAFPVLEALTFGKPVLVTDLPVYREYNKFFPNLIVNRGKSTTQMVETMNRLIIRAGQNPAVQNAKNNRKDGEKITIPPQFTWQHYVQHLFQLIN